MSQKEKMLIKALRNPDGLSFMEFQIFCLNWAGSRITKQEVMRYGIPLRNKGFPYRIAMVWPKDIK